MKFRAALFALLLPWPAFGQTRQPAQITTIPAATPQEVDLLDRTGAWVPLGQIDPINHFFTFAPNPNPALTPTGSLSMGMNVLTAPGNIPNGMTAAGYKIWNLIYPRIDSYWSDPSLATFNVGLDIEARLNPSNSSNVNGSIEAILTNAVIHNSLSSGSRYAVGGQFNANIVKNVGGVHTTLGASALCAPTCPTSITLTNPTGFLTGDGIYVVLDSGKVQHFNNITVSGSTVSWASPLLASQATMGNTVYDPKGVAYGHSSISQIGSTATDILEVTDAEENVIVPAGASVLLKSIITLVPAPGDATHGVLEDAAIGISAQTGSVGIQDGILFSSFNGIFPITLSGGLMKVDGHNVSAQNIGYGIDMTWAHFHTSDGGSGNAFAFATAGNGVADNYWSNTQLVVSGNMKVGGSYYAGPGATLGVSCSGTPPINVNTFTSVNGIVTHC